MRHLKMVSFPTSPI